MHLRATPRHLLMLCAMALAVATSSWVHAQPAPPAKPAAAGPATTASPAAKPVAKPATKPPAPPAGPPASLLNFHRALQELESGRRQRLVALQIGDSHTAADHFTNRLRTLLQERFGNAGRGPLPPGVPYDYYRPYEVRVTQSENWVMWSSRRDGDPGPFGMAGFRLRGDSPRDYVELESTESNFDAAEIEILAQPGGGSLIVSVDGNVVGEFPTAARAFEARRIAVPMARPGRILAVVPRGNGQIELLGWNIWRRAKGVTVANLGFPGAAVQIMERFDQDILSFELAALNPALIVIAFGTNEGFSLSLDAVSYRQQFAERLAQWRQLAPHASLVVIGPPVALRLPDYCAPDPMRRERLACGPVAAKDVPNYVRLLSQQSNSLCKWHEPPPERTVRDIQRAVAAQYGAFFWDWAKVPDGPCGMDAWARRNPALAHKDRVHMRPDGYALGAEALYKELLAGYRSR